MTSPRYGIFSVDPYGPSATNVALGVADNLAKLRGMNALNQERELLNQKTTATQPGAIDFENFKNGFLQKSMPLAFQSSQDEAASRLLNDQSGRSEAAARSNLYGAQAGAAVQKSPLDFIRELQGVLKNSSPNSPEYQYSNYQLGSILSSLGASPEQFGMSESGKPSGNMMNTGNAGTDLTINPLSKSSRSMRGAEGYVKNPDGSYTYYSSPTTGNKTQNQNRQAAENELGVLWKPVAQGIKPYQGAGLGPDFKLAMDSLKAKFGDKAAEERLKNFALAMSVAPEVANTIGRMSSGGQAGIEMSREIQEANMKGLPFNFLKNNLIPQSALNAAVDEYQPLQSAGVNAAVNASNAGYPITSDTQPYYGAPPKSLSYTDLIKGAQPQAQQPQQNQPQSGWQGSAYVGSDGRQYTREELEQIAKGGK